MPGNAAINGLIALDGIQIIVTYESGPEIVLTPSGGNIEHGQSVTVTSNVVVPSSLSYAVVQGNYVIPLIPKIIPLINPDGTVNPNGGEVILQIPYPAPDDPDDPDVDPCTDGLGACPDCEDCLDPCLESLESQVCKECMEDCLDCLIEFFENISHSEECNESTREPPDVPVPITIIAYGPGFSGSVPLGNFVILVTKGSGIYQFVNGKTNDTLYSSTRDGTTYDVKIPNPFAKTGFFRS